MSTPWTLSVLRAFRDVMDGATNRASVPSAFIGWPGSAGFPHDGRYRPFVWFERDAMDVFDGVTNHELTVVTGIVFDTDAGKASETELEQAIAAYYPMRAAIATAAETRSSDFNSTWAGVAQPEPNDRGVRPSGDDDYDGRSTIGERWLVVGKE